MVMFKPIKVKIVKFKFYNERKKKEYLEMQNNRIKELNITIIRHRNGMSNIKLMY